MDITISGNRKELNMFKKAVIVFTLVVSFLLTSTGIASACTIFTISDEDTVFFGNNEDYSNPNTYYWVDTPGDGKYGGVYFGFDNFWPQGGINEKGLAFDINSLPEAPLNPHPEHPYFNDYEGYSILRNCATVEEVIEHVQQFNWGSAMGGQVHVADASGDAVVIGPGIDGELAFTRKTAGDGFIISTNFNVAEGYEYDNECDRYETTLDMLSAVGTEEELTLDYVSSVLDAVHVQGMGTNTLYSTVYDLKNGKIFVYYYHKYDEVVELNVAETISAVKEPAALSELFPSPTVEAAASEHSRYVFLEIFLKTLIIIVPLVAVILVFFFVRRRRKRAGKFG
jgi:hypothetical protein